MAAARLHSIHGTASHLYCEAATSKADTLNYYRGLNDYLYYFGGVPYDSFVFMGPKTLF